MKVLIVDDHTLIRDALRSVIAELDPDAVMLEAVSYSEAESLISSSAEIDLVLLDLGLPDGEGLALLQTLRAAYSSTAVVVMSGTKDQETVTKALKLGAQGFIPKSAQRSVMVNGLRLVIDGGVYIPPEALDQYVPQPNNPTRVTNTISAESLGITDRQLEVLALMMHGKSNKAICRELDLAEATVKNHVTAVLKALNATNRTEAVIAAGTLGWALKAPRGRVR